MNKYLKPNSRVTKLIIITLISFSFFLNNLLSFENKIEYKINNEIITSIDISNEVKYLTSFNPKLLDLDKNKILEISRNSIIKEKIKKIEINKYKKTLEIDQKYLSQIIEKNFKKINIKSESELVNFLNKKDLKYSDFKEKLIIESLWNEIIFFKFRSKININKNKLKEDLIEFNNKEYISYNLSEIIFNLEIGETINSKKNLIIQDIKIKGFENSALIHSVSSTSNSGGELGWVESALLNKKLRFKVSNLKIGQLTEPITIPGGFLILKLNDIRKDKKKINLDAELDKLIKLKTNQQLNQFSNIYFNKIKKDIKIEKI